MCLVFLGIEIDTTSGSMRLPEEKLARLHQTLQSWAGRKACTRRELKSLVGLLHHARRVIRPAANDRPAPHPQASTSSAPTEPTVSG